MDVEKKMQTAKITRGQRVDAKLYWADASSKCLAL